MRLQTPFFTLLINLIHTHTTAAVEANKDTGTANTHPHDEPRGDVGVAAAAAGAWPTRTKIWSTVESSVTAIQWVNPRKATQFTTKTVTTLEPRPTFASYPGTVTEIVISHVTWEGRTTSSNGDTSTSVTSFVATVPETWVVSRPSSTPRKAGAQPLPAGTKEGGLPCGGGCSSSSSGRPSGGEDPLCEATGMRTGCQGQCVMHEENEWWCYMLHQRDYKYPEMRMGRACWGPGGRYRQLNTPCLVGDVGMACVPCQGLDSSWGAGSWEGPEANNDGI
ncbi:hypothetical protein B0H66DRAFT_389492 [Apodospora peruviana]|uniref:Uncharacterized protein n=1 Tax=Apodospora peruviana TaxID=516989 RepID=A0AAE0HUR0_9PEZI|nr:hypothetical protein B0H66DRAFT_389492 [Apodospora peruviana]